MSNLAWEFSDGCWDEVIWFWSSLEDFGRKFRVRSDGELYYLVTPYVKSEDESRMFHVTSPSGLVPHPGKLTK